MGLYYGCEPIHTRLKLFAAVFIFKLYHFFNFLYSNNILNLPDSNARDVNDL